MILNLKIISRNKNGLGSDVRHSFDEKGGTIGRSPEADWVLADPGRAISSCHARILFESGGFCLSDESTNGVFINGAAQPLGPNNPVLLSNDDQIRIGDYLILARISGGEGEVADTILSGHASLDELLDGGAPEGPEGEGGELTGDAPLSEGRKPRLLDPLAAFLAPSSENRRPDTAQDGGGAISAHFSPTKIRREPRLETPVQAEVDSLDVYLENLSREGAAGEALASSVPAASAAPLRAQGGLSREGLSTIPAEQRDLWPFFEALGIESLVLSAERIPDFLREAGTMVRQAVEGLVRLYTAPSEDGGGGRRAQVRPIEDNPLRLARDADEAMRLMFVERRCVHLKPQDALRECLDDIPIHNQAVAVGMMEAMRAVLRAFSPSVLQERFRKYGVAIGADMPSRARAWDMYEQYFAELERDDAAGLKRLFDDVFLQAYEREMRARAIFRDERRNA